MLLSSLANLELGVVQVFQTSSRAVLRQFKAHQRPVHVARFSPDKLHVLSGSDDATVGALNPENPKPICSVYSRCLTV